MRLDNTLDNDGFTVVVILIGDFGQDASFGANDISVKDNIDIAISLEIS